MARRRMSRMNRLGRTHCAVVRRRRRYEEESVGFCGTNGWLTRADSFRAPTYYLSRLQEDDGAGRKSELQSYPPSQRSGWGWFGVALVLLIGKGLWLCFSFGLFSGALSYLIAVIAVGLAGLGVSKVMSQRWRGDQKELEMPYDCVENGHLLPFDEGIPVSDIENDPLNRRLSEKRVSQ